MRAEQETADFSTETAMCHAESILLGGRGMNA